MLFKATALIAALLLFAPVAHAEEPPVNGWVGQIVFCLEKDGVVACFTNESTPFSDPNACQHSVTREIGGLHERASAKGVKVAILSATCEKRYGA